MSVASAKWYNTDELLEKLAKSGDEQGLETLMEVFALSGHKVRTMTQVGEYLRARIFGGNIDGLEVRGRLRMELASGLYNSLLSAPITPAKAIAGTNLRNYSASYAGLVRCYCW